MPSYAGIACKIVERNIFEFVHHNVLVEDMNDMKLEYVKFGNVGLNNHVSLSHSKISQTTHQWLVFISSRNWVPLDMGFYFTCTRVAILSESNIGDSIAVRWYGC